MLSVARLSEGPSLPLPEEVADHRARSHTAEAPARHEVPSAAAPGAGSTGERPPGTAEIPRPALEIGLMGTTGRSHRRRGVCQCVTLCHAKTPSTGKHHPVGRVQTCVIFLQHTRPPALPTAPPAHTHLHGLQDDLEKENKKTFTAVEEHSKTRRHRRGFRVSAKPGLARGPLLGGELTGGFSRP